MHDPATIHAVCRELLPEMTAFLDRLIRFESVSGNEEPAMQWVHEHFRSLADECELVPFPDGFAGDPELQYVLDGESFEGRHNLRAVMRGNGTGRSVIFNAHIDVVPPSDGHDRPFDPYVEDGVMYGRGTMDDKGQIAVMWLVMSVMRRLGIRPGGDIVFHVVTGEETGGNGSLAMNRHGDRADCCVVLDGDAKIYPSVRGALWFTLDIRGVEGHIAAPGNTVSAVTLAIEAIRILEEYHDDLLARTRGDDPLFDAIPDPMPITFGTFDAGDWPSMVAKKARIRGVLGILTTPKEQVMHEMAERLRTRGSAHLAGHFALDFPYRHDTMRTDPDAPFVRTLAAAFEAAGAPREIAGLPASADGCFYSEAGGMPTVLTGAGKLTDAHTARECVGLDDLAAEAAALVGFIGSWCGGKGERD